MDTQMHTMADLFDQLGLDSHEQDIQKFIDEHRPLESSICLHEAQFWSVTQAKFLKDQTIHDADWVVVVDELNARLR